MEISPPIPVRIEWADSQGNVTASWLAAHFKFRVLLSGVYSWTKIRRAKNMTTSWHECDNWRAGDGENDGWFGGAFQRRPNPEKRLWTAWKWSGGCDSLSHRQTFLFLW